MTRIALGAVLGCALGLASGAAQAQGYSVVGGGGGTTRSGAGNTGTTENPPPPPGAPSGDAGGAGAAGNGGGVAIIRRRGGSSGEDDGAVGLGASHHPWEYGGVVPPGNGVVPPGFTRGALRRAGNRVLVAWPGFQMTEGGSRIFLAVNRTPQISVARAAGRLVYRLSNAMVPVRNNRRVLETRAFETPVSRAYLRQRGRDVELIIELRAAAEPQVTQQASAQGLGFVYLDFGRWSPPRGAQIGSGELFEGDEEQGSGRAGGAAPSGGVGSGVRPSAGPAVDTERPPPVRR